MKTKLKLKKWVKVVLTIMLLMIWLKVYNCVGVWGELAQTSNFYLGIDIIGIFYLTIGNLLMLSLVWDN